MENSELLKTIDGASLAYLGDSVFELWVRERLIRRGITHSGPLNQASHAYVTAKSQNAAFHRIEGMLTEEETAYFKRGRNSSHLSVPKSASGAEYRTATGFETLCAALWLADEKARLFELLEEAFKEV
ncbi:MAG: ribonuclease III [Clostridia bacterium]|nr:ribonuclease III [Clostridia bacterium]